MPIPPTTLERAFALARSGECTCISEVKERLKLEGFDESQIEGPVLIRQLNDLCRTYFTTT